MWRISLMAAAHGDPLRQSQRRSRHEDIREDLYPIDFQAYQMSPTCASGYRCSPADDTVFGLTEDATTLPSNLAVVSQDAFFLQDSDKPISKSPTPESVPNKKLPRSMPFRLRFGIRRFCASLRDRWRKLTCRKFQGSKTKSRTQNSCTEHGSSRTSLDSTSKRCCRNFISIDPTLPFHYRSRILEETSLMCNSWTTPRHNGDIFGGLNDGLLSRAEALAAVDMGKHPVSTTPGLPQLKHDMMYHHGMGAHPGTPNSRTHQMGHHGMDGLEMLDPISTTSMTTLTPMSDASGGGHHQLHSSMYGPGMNMMTGHHHHHGGTLGGPTSHHGGHHHPAHAHHPAMAAAAAAAAAAGLHPDADTDPRELEAFAERFKQRRIKLGVTQADVGKALANLKLPGVGALSQSTICRFESLTLSHNNMIALKPILQAWLEEAEAQAKNKRRDPDAPSVLPAGEKKRKRTSIAAPEKRSLEAYFAVQPRPSGEKIAAIAEKLDLKKNVVRVWFCNQRQKQKRMKFAAQH